MLGHKRLGAPQRRSFCLVGARRMDPWEWRDRPSRLSPPGASTALWTFIGEHVKDTVYNNRGLLSGGGDNGLELWRGLLLKHEGGAEQVELGGMGTLRAFPHCDEVESPPIVRG